MLLGNLVEMLDVALPEMGGAGEGMDESGAGVGADGSGPGAEGRSAGLALDRSEPRAGGGANTCASKPG